MKILVDKMPTKVEDCPWSSPIDNPWGTRTIWFCDWALNNGETCPMVKDGECPFFTSHEKILEEKVIDELNKIGEVYPLSPGKLAEVIRREYGN